MKTNCGIYRIRNTKNNKIYTGSSSNIRSRKYQHFWKLENNSHENDYLQKAYNKLKKEYNGENVKNYFKFEIMEYVEKIEDKIKLKGILLKYENLELNKYKKEDGSIDRNRCYNILPIAGSNLGRKASEEEKLKLSTLRVGEKNSFYGKKHSMETKQKISKSNKGRKHTPEEKKKQSEKQTGRKFSKETKEKISNSNKGKEQSLETREKIRLIKTGLRQSKETIEKRIIKNRKKVINLTLGTVFNSILEASEYYNIVHSSICAVCKGKRETAGGHKWKYFNED